jgi:glucose-1-phosphate thymidylyltransferase
MKGIVLAGGTGSRLFPLTKITNKHLLPIYDKPMIYYPIQTLVDAGIEDMIIVTGGKNSGDFPEAAGERQALRSEAHQLHLPGRRGRYRRCAGLANTFADRQKICVVLGDNIIEGDIRKALMTFVKQESGAKILLKEVTDAERFGVAEFRATRLSGSKRSRANPKSEPAVTGIYMYDGTVFDKIRTLVPSKRGELGNYRRQ